jgi:hypothetical protein
VTFNVYGTSNLSASGPVAFVRLRGQRGGGTPLTLTPRIAADAAGASVLSAVTAASGALCVAQAIRWGEVSGDGVVNVIDAQQIARFSVGLSVSQPTLLAQSGDVTGDGNVNVLDAQQIARFSVGLSASLRTNTVVYTPPAATGVQLLQSATQSLVAGETVPLGAEPVAADGTGLLGCQAVQWSSSDASVATVDASGTVTAIAPGTATLTASVGGNASPATTAITVSEAIAPAQIGSTLAVGRNHTCALDAQGKAYCWGYNQVGQIGDGTLDIRLEPVPVVTDVRFVSLAAGQFHTCGLVNDGKIYCWGGNASGQLGDGTTTDRTLPVQVTTVARFTRLAFSANANTSCALTEAGVAYCWGRNSSGQIGDGTTSDQHRPTRVDSNGIRFASIDTHWDHSCALTPAGEGYCWGSNSSGQLGDGTAEWRTNPAKVTGNTTWRSISTGWGFTCAISTDDQPFCWGRNGVGQLGDGGRVGCGDGGGVGLEIRVFEKQRDGIGVSRSRHMLNGLHAAGSP